MAEHVHVGLSQRAGPVFGVLAMCLVLAVGATSVPTSASAASKELQKQARQMSNTAAKLFAKKNYLEAGKLFEQAHALDPQRTIRLRNAGRAYEEAKRDGNALRCFQQYVKITTDEKLRKDVLGRIERLKVAGAVAMSSDGKVLRPKAKPAESNAPQRSSPAPTSSAANSSAPGSAAPASLASNASQGVAPSSPNWMLTAGGAGLAVVGASWLVYAAMAGADVEQHANEGHYDYSEGPTKLKADRDAVSQNKLASAAVLGTGLVAAGLGWFVLRKKATNAALLLPAFSADGIHVTARLSY